ncbi:uncharacterized protein LOC129720530 [Wyeomyia smithii]|uniref:uncharacterized protein LOC129720530 n=1 Tax=Wyeomyia smithii TaxID=174621 RepID=UPI002467E0FF|nr:uncharacterized protein LOC129720530 [Wyeomyia smithii]
METSLSLPNQRTIFSAEVAAAHTAAVTQAERPLAILTDLASVVTALQSDTVSHPWLQQLLLEVSPDTTFVWIPGHYGISSNEKADHLAKLGRNQERFTNSIPATDLKSWVTKVIEKKWTENWLNTGREGTRKYFLRRIKMDTTRWNDPPIQQEQRTLSRLRTGHTSFAYNMSGGEFKTQCPTCRVHQSVEHVLCHCPHYQTARNKHGIPESIGNALGNQPTTAAAVILYLKDIGLYEQT